MPTYLYTFQRGPKSDRVPLQDEAAAWGETVRACAEVLSDIDGSLSHNETFVVSVQQENGYPLWQIECRSSRL